MTNGKSKAQQRRAQAVSDNNLEEEQRKAEERFQTSVWNRDPLKQYVRRFSWMENIRAYVKKMRDAGVDREWKYLTFPGPAALDVAFLDENNLLDRTPTGALCVAICDKVNAEAVALKMAKHGGLMAYSQEWLHEALRDEADPVRKEFPFDVINLDFCNPFVRTNRDNLEALDNIFRLQRGQGFLLLFTSRPNPSQSQDHLRVLRNNLESEDHFRERYIHVFGGEDAELALQDYTNFSQLIYTKIVARFARIFGYKLIEHHTARYSRPAGFEMVSHCFELEPIGRAPANIHEPRFNRPFPRETFEQVLQEELSSRVQRLAAREYGFSIALLPERPCVQINQELENDGDLEARLDHEARDLEAWLM